MFYIISETHGLLATADNQEEAEYAALIAAVNTGRTVHLHDRAELPPMEEWAKNPGYAHEVD